MLLERISLDLGLDTDYLTGLASAASHHYKKYEIPKKSGGSRLVFHPSKELKAIQRWLSRNVISLFRVHPAAMAYRPRIGLRANAEIHAGNRYLLRMDLRDFFGSIRTDDVTRLFDDNQALLPQGWTSTDTELFCSFVMRNGRLTIGAVTSPAVSNVVFYETDLKLASEASSRQCKYTRYADDLFFSSKAPNRLGLIQQEVELLFSSKKTSLLHVEVNERKTRHQSTKTGRQVTGLVLTDNEGISLGRGKKRALRARIHRATECTQAELESLRGYLAYVHSVEPGLLTRLIEKYGAKYIQAIQEGRRPIVVAGLRAV